MLSFVEAFKIMGLVFLVMIPMVILLKDPKKNAGVQAVVKEKVPAEVAEETRSELVHA
jgi:hypothetical protein